MIRISLRLLLTGVLFLVFPLIVHADVVDHCADLSLSYASYSNFSSVPGGSGPGGGWQNPPDRDFLLVTSALQPASVVYTLQGAERIGISIYSRMATFATQNDQGQYILGLQSAQMVNQKKYRTYYCDTAENEGQIFMQLGNQTLRYYRNERYKSTFVPVEHPHNHNQFMGVNAYASTDGSNFTPLPLSFERVMVKADDISITHYYEQYAASVPAGAKYIKVVLRDFTAIDAATGILPLLNPSRLHLAEVRFQGANIVTGNPPPPSGSSQGQGQSNGSGSEQTTGGGLIKDILKEWLGEASSSSKEPKKPSSSSAASVSRPTAASQSSAASSSASSAGVSSGTVHTSADMDAKPVVSVQTVSPAPQKSNWKTITMTAVYLLSAVGVVGRLAYKLL